MTLIVPDKDADGLTSGAILRTTLRLLGLLEELIQVHLLSRGTNVHDELERTAMASHHRTSLSSTTGLANLLQQLMRLTSVS